MLKLFIPALLIGALALPAAAGHGEAEKEPDHAHMHHEVFDLSGRGPMPAVHLEIKRDPMSGWNALIRTRNFRFAPQHASLEHVPGEGHAHIYANGVKLGRVYGHWYHIGSLPKGKVVVKASLNANDHRALAVNGQPVESTVELVID